MQLVAINTIERMDGKRRVTVEPGEKFTASEDEANELLERRAVRKIADVKEQKKAPEKRTRTSRTSADQNFDNPDSDKIGDDSATGLSNSSNTDPALPADVDTDELLDGKSDKK